MAKSGDWHARVREISETIPNCGDCIAPSNDAVTRRQCGITISPLMMKGQCARAEAMAALNREFGF